MKDMLMDWIGMHKCVQIWFHSAHHCTKGTGFAGDHELLYGDIYQTFFTDLDMIVEKSIGICNDESISCPLHLCKCCMKHANNYPTPCEKDATYIAAHGLALMKDYVKYLTAVYNTLKNNDQLTLGTDDLIMSLANNYESYIYKLQQRVKAAVGVK
jgi:DNA-binding ferritin-like protein